MGGQNIYSIHKVQVILSAAETCPAQVAYLGYCCSGRRVHCEQVSEPLGREGNLQSSPQWYIVLLVLGSELLAAGFHTCKAPFEGL